MHYETFQNLILAWMLVAVAVFLLLLRIVAPYGRHTSPKWGPLISNRLGWIIMEAPVLLLVAGFMISSAARQNAMSWTLAGLFMLNYVNRTFVFPFRIHTKGKKMPLVITFSAIGFNLVNGFFLGYFFAHFAQYQAADFLTPNFLIGLPVFFFGMYLNWTYDNRLIHLRAPGSTGYVIPRGGLFELISCPNLFGEIVEWTGFAILCWNLPALAFLVWTLANLVPRAISHHKWYQQQFTDYPKGRKAVFPFWV